MSKLLKPYLYADMDGTLLTDTKDISDENVAAIKRYIDAGGKFAVATGRSELIAKPLLKGAPLNMPSILYNGAAVYDFEGKKFLHQNCLDYDLVERLGRLAIRVCPTACVEVYCEGPIQLLNRDCVIDHYITNEKQEHVYRSFEERSRDCMKLLVYGENAQLKEVERAIAEEIGSDGFSCVFSAPYYLEILPADISKGDTLKWIADNLGYKLEDMAVIGDFYNDLSMILESGFGVAPANAPDDIKAQAQLVVADNNHRALADLINNHMIIED